MRPTTATQHYAMQFTSNMLGHWCRFTILGKPPTLIRLLLAEPFESLT
jgi:hypothetical protein